jgi:cell division protein FtsZ
MRQADAGIAMLKTNVDSLIVVRNDRLLTGLDKKISVKKVFKISEDVFVRGVQCISYAIKIYLDFADIKNMFKGSGFAYMGIGIAKDDEAKVAVVQAICSPLF